MRRFAALGWSVTLLAFAVGLAGLVGFEIHHRFALQKELAENLSDSVKALSGRAEPLFSLPIDQMDTEIRRWAAVSGLRITVIRSDGVVLSDTWTVPNLVGRMENHLQRPEVFAATRQEVGISRRRSITTDHMTTYAARLVGPTNHPLGFVRLAREDSTTPWPWAWLIVIILVSMTAGSMAAWRGNVLQRSVAKHLAMWSNLPDSADIEAIAIEGARTFQNTKDSLDRELMALRVALGEMNEGVVLLDHHDVIRYGNPAAMKILKSEGMIGLPFVEVTRLPELTALIGHVQRAGKEGHTEVERDDTTTLAVSACPLDHPTLAIALIFRDLSLERQLHKARRAFVADLAHELRTPITVLGGLAEEFAIDGVDPQMLTSMERQVRRLATFAQDLDELAQIEAGRIRLQNEPCDVVAITRQVIGDLSPVASNAKVELTLIDEPSLMMTDPIRLAQVLTNVIDNGIRYNRVEGHVMVNISHQDETIRFEIRDDGIGIPRSEVPLVFQRLYRVRGMGRPEAGSGLGLAIVKHLVKALGGSVQLVSEDGKGTTVTLTFPIAPNPQNNAN